MLIKHSIVAGQPAARVGCVVSGADEERMANILRQTGSAKASYACSRRLSRGTTQHTPSINPALAN